jgi:hypothetical protein
MSSHQAVMLLSHRNGRDSISAAMEPWVCELTPTLRFAAAAPHILLIREPTLRVGVDERLMPLLMVEEN